ncbi:MAG: hydrolase [Acidihalobacter sp.]
MSPAGPSAFRPAWWLPGPHLQTLWPYLIRPYRRLALRRERLELPDGDFLDLDWTTDGDTSGLVLVLHGLEGSSASPYVQRLLRRLRPLGMRAVVMHFRGCSGEPNRLARGYHAGDTADLSFVVDYLRQQQPQRPLAAIGYSLGANVLLKWLGETAQQNPLRCAAAVSVPFELEAAADKLESGISRLYQRSLLRSLRRSVARKYALRDMPIPRQLVEAAPSLRAFDDCFTAPLHGFRNAEDYYRRSSCRPWLPNIKRPTLIVHAADDPFLRRDAVPSAAELPPGVELQLTPQGGHVGFVAGCVPGRTEDWLGSHTANWLALNLI